jgi:hypothetical protein
MIELRVHNWKHRVTNSGLLISSPAEADDWKERGMEDMSLPQIARSEIRNTIVDYSEKYPENFVVRKRGKASQPEFNANKAR